MSGLLFDSEGAKATLLWCEANPEVTAAGSSAVHVDPTSGRPFDIGAGFISSDLPTIKPKAASSPEGRIQTVECGSL
jgi:hypothetical protein